MSAIYAIIPATQAVNLNLAFAAMQFGPDVFSVALTDAPSPTENATATHFHMYNASASPTDYAAYAAAKAGTALPLDFYGNPVAWGEEGLISEADAYEAFAALQLWANDSDRNPGEFAAEQRAGLGLSIRPMPL